MHHYIKNLIRALLYEARLEQWQDDVDILVAGAKGLHRTGQDG